MKTADQVRLALLDFLRRDLIGPAGGHDEVLSEEPPRIRYVAGVLFPQESRRNESEAAGGLEGDEISGEEDEILELDETAPPRPTGARHERAEDDEYDDIVTLANTYRPSAMGLSFMVEPGDSRLTVQVRAARYRGRTEKDPGRDYPLRYWDREPLSFQPLEIDFETQGTDETLCQGLNLRVVIRPRGAERYLVTLSLYNTTRENERPADTFYQVGFDVEAADGSAPFVEYRTLEGAPEDDEESALAMLYRNRRIFAAGHGCAADWKDTDSDRTTHVATAVLPHVIVPPVDPVSGNHRYLNMQFLQGDCDDPARQIPEALEELCSTYESWIVERVAEAHTLEERFRASAERHLGLCRTALRRMRAGIDLLLEDRRSLEAFMIANRVMLMQQRHSKLRRTLDTPWMVLPRDRTGYDSNWEERRGFWWSFQIAFILMALPGLTGEDARVELGDHNVEARDLVDLVWFPTGGGKTEAYLGLTAFTIFRSRLDKRDDSGCKVLMRYTLRLLTSQQFQRAASLICACEVVRREDLTRYGRHAISIGLWVGMSLTPNDEKSALQDLTRLARKGHEAKNPFQLLTCPWCGTELDNPERYGYAERHGQLVFQCPARKTEAREGCPFSELGSHLPVCVVDESIYANPPTLIIGTVDKFAMLAWRKRASALLTVGGGPELIIQDELHLISGPLGSMVGLYEGVIDYLCRLSGRNPKIIASTATIRRAELQCKALYDRRMFQFPPPGLDASDSFFAVENQEAPGRLYVGFLPTAASSPLTAQIRSVVALQQGVPFVGGVEAPADALDPYWTLVQYFGSLRELGRAATFISADIPEFLPTMHRRFGIVGDRRRWMNTSEELTSRKNEDEIPKILKRLETRYQKAADWEHQALDTVLATNMISVGVDIDRLGLMMVVTQPKGTSEYIQASSRVGRSTSGPGLVFTLYNAARPRDRSHYEHFRGYHEAFYRFVEPTSVTPFAPPAMERALHAVLVIAGRHVARWARPSDIDPADPAFLEFLEFLQERVRSVDPEHLHEFEELLRLRVDEWEMRCPESWGSLAGVRDEPALMRPSGTAATEGDAHSWETPTSMRNVDVECGAEVTPRYIVARGMS